MEHHLVEKNLVEHHLEASFMERLGERLEERLAYSEALMEALLELTTAFSVLAI